jgi:hypothetical protein
VAVLALVKRLSGLEKHSPGGAGTGSTVPDLEERQCLALAVNRFVNAVAEFRKIWPEVRRLTYLTGIGGRNGREEIVRASKRRAP